MRAPRSHDRSPAPRHDAALLPLLEGLEPRVHLAALAYQTLADYLDVSGPMHVLRPSGDSGSATTIHSSVASIGDVDGDGHADILVGAAGRGGNDDHDDDHDDHDHGRRSVAAVYSGRTGRLLLSVSDGSRGFGSAVAGIGDVNGDGTPDFAVGSPLWGAGSGDDDDHDDDDDNDGGPRRSGRGRAYVYSGADGALLFTFTGEHAGGRFGSAVAAAGDVDGGAAHDGSMHLLGVGQGGSILRLHWRADQPWLFENLTEQVRA